MIPIVTPEEMAAVDAAAPEPVEILIDRAGRAVALAAVEMLGGVYGRRIVVLAGPGNNGADGRMAAGHLRRRGVRVVVIDALDAPERLPVADLVIDAAFGTGLRRAYDPPSIDVGSRVLAVDIPSGVDGLTGQCLGSPLMAERTLTFAALKPGLVLEPGRSFAGDIHVADIGLDIGAVSCHVLTDADVAELLPERAADDHKWRSGLRIIGGSPGMTGAASLAARGAQRTGAGIVQLAMPGASGTEGPTEAVAVATPLHDWSGDATKGLDSRIRAVLIGPGLGRDEPEGVLATLDLDIPLVIDGDALIAELVGSLSTRRAATVLTPHDGEWQRLGGGTGPDRLALTKTFAIEHGVTVIRKGPTTVVAAPDGRIRVVTAGTAALATAGTGDVLAGVTIALLALGLDPFDAAAAAAHAHARAGAALGDGLVAGDVADAIPGVLRRIRTGAP